MLLYFFVRHNFGNKSLMIETYKVRLEILKAKIENKPPLVIQKLHLSDYTNISGSEDQVYSSYSPGKSFSFKWSYNIF